MTGHFKDEGNYVHRRKIGASVGEKNLTLRSKTTLRLDRSQQRRVLQDLGEMDDEDWEKVASDTDHTLRTCCSHYNECFYSIAPASRSIPHSC